MEIKNEKSEIAYVDFSAGENQSLSTQLQRLLFIMKKHIMFIQYTTIMDVQLMGI